MIHNKKIFITGGAGFIATSLIKQLITKNEIIVYDNFFRNSLKDSGLIGSQNLHIIEGDILNYTLLKSSIPGDINLILHMAAIAGIDTVIKDPVKTMEVNTIGTHNILKAIDELNIINSIERFVNFSTSEVFGINAFKVDEKTPANLQPVGEARWVYSVSKLASEHFVNSYHKKFGLKTVIIRPFNIYGPGQIGEGAIHQFVVRAIKNQDLIIHGEGNQIRAWCYIDDIVEGIILCLKEEAAIGEVFNLGNPRSTITIFNLAEKIIQLAQSKSKIIHIPQNYADVNLRIPNIDKAHKLLGFKPKIDLNEGLNKTIEWYKKNEI